MSRSKKNWNELVDEYGNYDFTNIFATVNGVTQGELDEQLRNYVSRSGDIMDGGLFVKNDLGYAYAIEPISANRPAGTTEFTRNGRIIAEQYWDIGEQRLNFNVRDVNGVPQLEDSLEIGRDRIRINAECDLNGDLFVKGDSLTETLEALSSEINYQVGLLEGKIATKYNKTGGDISGVMSVTVGGDTKLTVNRLGVTLGQNPTQNFHAATKQYVDQAVQNIDLTGALTFLGVRDITTVDPVGDEILGNIYAAGVAGTPTAAWGLSADVSEGDLVGLGENGWIVIGQVGLPDLSGYATIVDSETADGLLSDRLDILEADSVTKTYVDAADLTLSGRLDVLEADPITKTESDAGDQVLSDRIDAIEGDYVVSDNYIQDQADLANTLATFLPLAGGTMTGELSLSGNTISNVADPTNAGDAVNKAYVEGELAGYLKQSGDTVNTGSEVVYDFQNGIKFYNWGTDFAVTHRYVKIETDSQLDLIANDDLILRTIDGGDIYLKPSGSVNVNNRLIRSVRAPYSDGDAANKGYVDSKFDSIGTVLVFKGVLDFTTEAAPNDAATGHVYSNSGTGTPHASWGLTGDVAAGELYGRGETQWGRIGSAEADLSNTIPLSGTVAGQPVTGNIDLGANVNINLVGNGAGLNIETGYWGGLFYEGSLQLEFGMNGLKTGTDINMKGGNTGYNDPQSEQQYNNVGGGFNSILHGHGIHWLKAPEHKYDAVNKEHVDNNFLGLNFNNLPVLS